MASATPSSAIAGGPVVRLNRAPCDVCAHAQPNGFLVSHTDEAPQAYLAG